MEKDGFKRFGRKDDGIEVLVDIRTSELKLSEVMRMIEIYQRENPDREVFMDGDLYAVIARKREVAA